MKHRFHRFLALGLILALIATSLLGCGYKPRKSTEKEATPIFTFGDNIVNFEVLRAFFFTECSKHAISSTDDFEKEGGAEKFRAVMADAIADIAEVYAMLALCRELKIDPLSEEIEEEIEEKIKLSVDGGIIGDKGVTAFGSYKKYLAYLEETYHINDAVNRLMIRYAICEERVADHYDSNYAYTEEDVESFFKSEDCIYVALVHRFENTGGMGRSDNLSKMQKARNYLLANNVRLALQQSPESSLHGYFYLSHHSLDEAYYAPLTEELFSMGVGTTSAVIDLGPEGFFVAQRLPKPASALTEDYESLAKVYLGEVMYGRIDAIAAELLNGIVYTEFFSTLTAEDILGEA